MANLQNKRIKDTYEGLIKTNDNNAISSEVELTDGAGNGTGVSVSTDGRVVASGTVSFGSLKDTGENITITKFVDEADGIANNDNDTSIPTVAAVKDYVDSTELDTVTSVNTQTGDVVLDTDDISEGSSNLYYTEARVSANTSVAANTLKNTYPSADATKVGHITVTQAVDLDTLESNVATNNAKISFDSTSSTKLAGIESGAEVNPTSTDELSEGSTNLYYTDARVESNSAVAANTAKTGITSQQAADITTNNAKVGITTTQADAITANSAKISFDSASSTKLAGIETNADVTDVANVTTALNSIDIQELSNVSSTDPTNNQVLQFSDTTNKFEPTTLTSTAPVDSVNTQTGAVVLDTDDIDEGTSNLYYTDARVSANSDVTANTAKNSYPTADATKLAGIEAGAEVNPTSTDGLSEGSTNLYYTEARVSANTNVAANTLKNSYPSADATKVGFISVTQAVNLDTIESDVATNNAKVGITTQQASDITTNNAKISFDSTSSTKLGTIEENADVTDTANVTAAGALMDSEVDADIKTLSLPANTTISSFAQSFLDDADAATVRATIGAGTSSTTGTVTEVTVGTGLDVTSGTSTPNITLDTANLYKVIGIATDHGNRVTLDNGTSEGATSIMQNFETLIFN